MVETRILGTYEGRLTLRKGGWKVSTINIMENTINTARLIVGPYLMRRSFSVNDSADCATGQNPILD